MGRYTKYFSLVHRTSFGPIVLALFCVGILIASRWPFSWWWVVSYGVHFFIFSFGIGFGLHRCVAHQASGSSQRIVNFAALVGVLGQVGSPLAWKTIHHLHHAYADTERDPHSPLYSGMKLFLGYSVHQPKEAVVEGMLAGTPLTSPFLVGLHHYYYLVVAAYSLSCFAVFGWRGLAHLALIPIGLSFLSIGMLNYFGHQGGENGEQRDRSQNVWWLWPLTFGENWHRNHHLRPRARRSGMSFFQLDPISFYFAFIKRRGVDPG